MHDVGADVASGALDELLDLLDEGVDDALPAHGGAHHQPGVAPGHVVAHGLGVTPRQPAGGLGATGQVKRFEDLHDLPVRLGQRSPSGGWHVVATTSQPAGETAAVDFDGRSAVRRPGFLLSVSQEFPVRLPGV